MKTRTAGTIQEAPSSSTPDERVISDFGESPYTHNGYCYLPVTTTEKGSYPAFYRIDPRTPVAVKGATVEAESVNATGWLNRQ